MCRRLEGEVRVQPIITIQSPLGAFDVRTEYLLNRSIVEQRAVEGVLGFREIRFEGLAISGFVAGLRSANRVLVELQPGEDLRRTVRIKGFLPEPPRHRRGYKFDRRCQCLVRAPMRLADLLGPTAPANLNGTEGEALDDDGGLGVEGLFERIRGDLFCLASYSGISPSGVYSVFVRGSNHSTPRCERPKFVGHVPLEIVEESTGLG